MRLYEVSEQTAVVQNRQISDRNSSAGNSLLSAGDVIEGIITEAENGKAGRLAFSKDGVSHELSLPKDCVSDTFVGDRRRFEVVEAGADRLVLKDLGSILKDSASSLTFSTVDTQLSSLVTGFSETMGDKEKEDTDNIKNLSDEDYSELKHEGFSIEDFKAERLSRAIERVKKGLYEDRRFSEDGNEAIKEERRNIKKQAYHSLTKGDPQKEAAAEALIDADLPVTAENISSLTTALDMAQCAASLVPSSDAYLIRNTLTPTITNIYHAVYSGSNAPTARFTADKGSFADIATEAEKIVAASSVASDVSKLSSAPSLSDAKWLYDNDIPITTDNLIYLKQLETLKVDAGSDSFDKTVLSRACLTLEATGIATDALLIPEYDAPGYVQAPDRDDTSVNEVIISINKRLEIENARLTLTLSSASTLKKLGTDINTASIEEIIDELTALKHDYYMELTGELDIPADEQSQAADTAFKTELAISHIIRSKDDLLGISFQERHTVSLHALSSYELSSTQIRSDLGDSIEKAFRNVDSLLAENELEPTEANRRAVRILGRNSIDLTTDNINEMKYYDAKVTRLCEKLQPAVVMSMIKRGINPLYTPIDELNEALNRIIEEEGISSEEKYSTFLLRMEESGTIPEEQRNAFIGIYRLLYRINKNDRAALGAAIASKKELTLASLLTEERSASGHIDSLIGDAFGSTHSEYTNSITAQINEAFIYSSDLIGDILSQTEPAVWKAAFDDKGSDNNFENISVEHLSEILEAADNNISTATGELLNNDMLSASFAAGRIRDLMSNVPAGKLLKSFGIDDSATNIDSLLRESPVVLSPDDIPAVTDDSPFGTYENGYADFADAFSNALTRSELSAQNGMLGSIGASEAVSLTQMLDNLGLLQKLSLNRHYSFRVEGENPADVNLTFLHGAGSKGTVSIRLSGTVGTITAELGVSALNSSAENTAKYSVSGIVSFDTESGSLEADVSAFTELLDSNGFESVRIGCSRSGYPVSRYFSRLGELKSREQPVARPASEEAVSDNTLYRVATLFLKAFL